MAAASADNRLGMSRTGVCSLVAVLAALWTTGATLAVGAPRASRPSIGGGANRIAIDAPASAKPRKTYNMTIHGFARRRATAYLFVDYVGCAGSFATERGRAAAASDSYAVRGRFSELSGWKSSTRGADHACAYLVGLRSGAVLATARVSFQVR